MRTLPILTLAAACLAAAGTAQAEPRLLPERSEIVFTSRQMGVPVDGRFRRFDAQVAYDPKRPADAKIGLTIELGSVALGTAEVEAELRKPEWFDLRAFPQASFRSSAVRVLAPDRIEVAGTLAIKGSTRPLVVPVAVAQAGDTTTATGSFTLRRLDFRIGDGDWNDPALVADEVQVRFRLVLAGTGAP